MKDWKIEKNRVSSLLGKASSSDKSAYIKEDINAKMGIMPERREELPPGAIDEIPRPGPWLEKLPPSVIIDEKPGPGPRLEQTFPSKNPELKFPASYGDKTNGGWNGSKFPGDVKTAPSPTFPSEFPGTKSKPGYDLPPWVMDERVKMEIPRDAKVDGQVKIEIPYDAKVDGHIEFKFPSKEKKTELPEFKKQTKDFDKKSEKSIDPVFLSRLTKNGQNR